LKITHKISMDLDRYSVPGFDAVCGDRNTRELEITLYAGGQVLEIPAEATVSVRYQKPDGTGGFYDLLPDGSPAWGISGNKIIMTLAPQTLTVPGCVIMTVCLTAGEREISTFQILMNVRPAVGMVPADSGNYWYLSGSLPQPENAAVGEVLVVESVDSRGRVTALKTADVPGVTREQIDALEGLLKLAVYREDPAAAWRAFEAAFRGAVPATGIALSAMIASMSLGNKKQLTATVTPENSTDAVAWTSSDESVATVVDGLVTSVGKGDCVITATAGTVSATCSVSVRTVNDLIHTHSYTAAVTRAATCTEPGIKTYTCLCGESYTEEIPATGHSYADGVCTVCGAADPDASDETALLYRWDFTESLTDTVSGLAATAEVTTKADGCGEVPVQDSTGVHFTGIGQALNFGNIFALGRTYEIDVAELDSQGDDTKNMRFFTLWQGPGSDAVSGFLFRHTYNYWSVYSGGWANNPYGLTDRNEFSGKTVTLKIAADGACELLVDGVSKGTCSQKFTGGWNVLQLGSTAIDGNDTAVNMGGNLFDCTITGFRIYEGVE